VHAGRALLVSVVAASTAAGQSGPPLEARLAGAPPAVAARVHGIFADSGVAVERAGPTGVVGLLPERPRMGDRGGTQFRVRAALTPISADSTRVVLTGTVDVPQSRSLPAVHAPLPQPGRAPSPLERRAWARVERLHLALARAVDTTRARRP
jgi:hypothetical protein